MAVDGITGSTSVLLSALNNRAGMSLQSFSSQSGGANSNVAAAATTLNPYAIGQTNQPITAVLPQRAASVGSASVPPLSTLQYSLLQAKENPKIAGVTPPVGSPAANAAAVPRVALAPQATNTPAAALTGRTAAANLNIPQPNTLQATAAPQFAPLAAPTSPPLANAAVPASTASPAVSAALLNQNIVLPPNALQIPVNAQITATAAPAVTPVANAATAASVGPPTILPAVTSPAAPSVNILLPNAVNVPVTLRNIPAVVPLVTTATNAATGTATPATIATTEAPAARLSSANLNVTQPAAPQIASGTAPLSNPTVNATITTSALAAAPETSETIAAPAAQTALQGQEAISQNVRLVNETLRNVGVTTTQPPTNTLLFNTTSPLLTVLQTTRELNPIQQNALLTNELLVNLNYTPPEQLNPLLINETPAALEAAGITENLPLTQQNILQVNETLQYLGATPTAQAAVTAGTQTGGPVAVTLAAPPAVNVTVPVTVTGTTATTVTAATPVSTTPATAAVSLTAAAPTEVAIPVTAAFFTPAGFTPATFPLTLFPDRTPYVLVVYQPNDPAPLPRPPAPIDREVPPPTPSPEPRPAGNARLRQLLLHGGTARTTHADYYPTVATRRQAEKTIRYTLSQVNADMAAHGLPLHLVFARHGDEFAVDVYDCSYSGACQLSYDVPIPLDHLSDVLGNLQHETGIIVDKTT